MKKIVNSFLLTFLILFCTDASAELLAGASKIQVTPPESFGKLYLGGYYPNRQSKSVHDPLWARCAAISNGSKKIIIASVDSIGILWDDVKDIRKKFGLHENARVIITSTHTHSSPDSIGIYGGTIMGKVLVLNHFLHTNPERTFSDLPGINIFSRIPIFGYVFVPFDIPFFSGRDEDYMEYLKNQIVACLRGATENLEPAIFYVSQTEIRGIARNLREEGVLNNTSTVFKAEGASGNIFFIHNFGIHPAIMMDFKISADFLQAWYKEIEKSTGNGVAIWLQDALGAMVVPNSPNLFSVDEFPNQDIPQYRGRKYKTEIKDAWWNADWFGSQVGAIILKAHQNKDKSIDIHRLNYQEDVFNTSLRNKKLRFAHRLGIIKRPSSDNDSSVLETALGYLDLGELGIAFLPGETPPKLSKRIRQALSTRHLYQMNVSLANDELGYLIDEGQAEQLLPGGKGKLFEYEISISASTKLADILYEKIIGIVKNKNAAP